jgi:hypothetical protein
MPDKGKRIKVAAKPPPITIKMDGRSTNWPMLPPRSMAIRTTTVPATMPIIVAKSMGSPRPCVGLRVAEHGASDGNATPKVENES